MSNVGTKTKEVEAWIESQGNQKITAKDVFSQFEDTESRILAYLILELDYSDFEPLFNSIIENISLKERIIAYKDTILFGSLVDSDLKTVIECLNLGGEYAVLGSQIVNEVYLFQPDLDTEEFISEVKELNIFPNDFDSTVKDVQLMIDDEAEGDPFEETQQKIQEGEIELADSDLDYKFKSLQLSVYSELYQNQKKEFLTLVNRHSDNTIKDVPDSVAAIERIPNVRMTGRLEKNNVGFKLDLNYIGSVLGNFEVVKTPLSHALKKSAKKNIKTAIGDNLADVLMDVAVDALPIPGLHTGLKAVKIGLETIKDTMEDMQQKYSFEKEKEIFEEFLKSEVKDAREFLSEFYTKKIQEYFLTEFGYKCKDAELGLLKIMASKIVNETLSVCQSRIEIIKDKKIRETIDKSNSSQKETLIYTAVNYFAAHDFAMAEDVKEVFLKKNLLDL